MCVSLQVPENSAFNQSKISKLPVGAELGGRSPGSPQWHFSSRLVVPIATSDSGLLGQVAPRYLGGLGFGNFSASCGKLSWLLQFAPSYLKYYS